MNVLDAYNCDYEQLDSLIERHVGIGDRIDLPDGIYTTDTESLAAVVLNGRFIAELDIFDKYGEALM